jgi:hypothetical protein
MSTKRRILAALGVFAAAVALLGFSFVADAKKPPRLATLMNPPNAAPQPKSERPRVRAKKFLPVHDMGGY